MFAAQLARLVTSRYADRNPCTLPFLADPKEATPSLLLDRPCALYLISSKPIQHCHRELSHCFFKDGHVKRPVTIR